VQLCLGYLRIKKKQNMGNKSVGIHLSIAIDHLLSIKSAAATKVAGHANAEMIPLKTVCMAPSLINSNATPVVITGTLNKINHSTSKVHIMREL
jgi:hypothetical protein